MDKLELLWTSCDFSSSPHFTSIFLTLSLHLFWILVFIFYLLVYMLHSLVITSGSNYIFLLGWFVKPWRCCLRGGRDHILKLLLPSDFYALRKGQWSFCFCFLWSWQFVWRLILCLLSSLAAVCFFWVLQFLGEKGAPIWREIPRLLTRDAEDAQQMLYEADCGSGWSIPDPFGYYYGYVFCCHMELLWHKMLVSLCPREVPWFLITSILYLGRWVNSVGLLEAQSNNRWGCSSLDKNRPGL